MNKIARRTIISLTLLVIASVIMFIIWFCIVSYSNSHPAYGENVSKVKWLSEEVTNVSYYQSYSFTAYEFDIDEEGFKRWANKLIAEDGQLKKIEEPQKIERYNMMLSHREKSWDEIERECYAKIFEGYYYLKTYGESGGKCHIVYDSQKICDNDIKPGKELC